MARGPIATRLKAGTANSLLTIAKDRRRSGPAPPGAGERRGELANMAHGSTAHVQIVPFRGDNPGSSQDTGRDLGDARRPTIVANPPGDLRFRARIDAFLMAVPPRARDLEAALRAEYPAAVVRPRALAGERLDVWYVYRDGHWIRGADDAAG